MNRSGGMPLAKKIFETFGPRPRPTDRSLTKGRPMTRTIVASFITICAFGIIVLTAAAAPDPITGSSTPSTKPATVGSIVGIAVDEQGKPYKNAVVEVSLVTQGGPRKTVATARGGDDGKFTVADVPATVQQPYLVVVSTSNGEIPSPHGKVANVIVHAGKSTDLGKVVVKLQPGAQ
jgi:hypothetical protein